MQYSINSEYNHEINGNESVYDSLLVSKEKLILSMAFTKNNGCTKILHYYTKNSSYQYHIPFKKLDG
jgi:hypothetical protein